MDGLRTALIQIREKHAGRADYADVVYWTIRDAIRTGLMPAGARLSEAVMAGFLEISRTPVREAFQRLQLDHLIEKAGPRGGWLVPQATFDDLIATYEVTEVLFGLAARRAAQYLGQAELEILRDLIGQMESALKGGNLQALSEASRQFHSLIETGARNPRLTELIQLLKDMSPRMAFYEYRDPERIKDAVREHRDLQQAILARDASRAEVLARQHTRNALAAQIRARRLLG